MEITFNVPTNSKWCLVKATTDGVTATLWGREINGPWVAIETKVIHQEKGQGEE